MSSLTNVPTELKTHIFASLSDSDLFSVSRTCKVLYTAATECIYRNVQIVWEMKEGPLAFENNALKIYYLLRTVLESQDIANSIKSLMFSARSHGRRGLGYGCPRLHPSAAEARSMRDRKYKYASSEPTPGSQMLIMKESQEQVMVTNAIDRLHLLKIADLKGAILEEKSVQTAIALLILQCPNLRTLTLDTLFFFLGTDADTNPFIAMIAHVMHSRQGAKLESVTLMCQSTYTPLQLSFITPFFHLPNMPLLSLDDMTVYPSYSNDEISVRSSSFITKLYLTSIHLPAASLHTILQQTLLLHTLTYIAYLPHSKTPLYLDTVRKALHCVRGTLTHLTLGCDGYPDEAADKECCQGVMSGSLGSLKDLRALKSLAVPVAMLYGLPVGVVEPLVNMLSPGLETFVLRDDMCEYWEYDAWSKDVVRRMLTEFLNGKWRKTTPRLREIGLGDWESEKEDDYDMGDVEADTELENLCETKGLRFTSISVDRA
ncbi:hypothetical protein N0V90_003570 [Kalmusia sp. IMI 367209]|nr:hypothetical protein N0V90_003570 [Kalmusia sp. IMI 367209]